MDRVSVMVKDNFDLGLEVDFGLDFGLELGLGLGSVKGKFRVRVWTTKRVSYRSAYSSYTAVRKLITMSNRNKASTSQSNTKMGST